MKHQDEDNSAVLKDLLHTTRGRVTIAAEVVSLLAMVPFLVMDAGTFWKYDMHIKFWNLLEAATYILQVSSRFLKPEFL